MKKVISSLKVILSFNVCMNGGVCEYEMGEIEGLDYDVFEEEEVSEGVWVIEDYVIVVGESESECVERLKDYDLGCGLKYDYERIEGNMLGWILEKSN